MIDSFDYPTMLSMLREKKPFAFVRYGDGELNCMMGCVGANTKCEHKYSPELAKALKHAMVAEKDYHIGMMVNVLAGNEYSSKLARELAEKLPICSSLILHHASGRGKLAAFFKAVGPVVMVGPRHMSGMAPWLNITRHVEIPDRNCWEKTEKIIPQLTSGETYLFVASMPAKVWIREAWDKKTTLIDIGSVFDPYVGIKSRSYMRAGKYTLAESLV